jgi:predicted ArsR family transcriptional regulator
MTDPGIPDDMDDVRKERQQWNEERSTRDRVYETAIQLYEPTSAEEIADRAACSPGAARDHLGWFADRGIVEVIDGRPKQYKRNQSYFDWKQMNEFRRTYTRAELQNVLEELVAEEESYQEKYEENVPRDVNALEQSGHAEIHDVWQDITHWKTVRRRIRLIERARKEREYLSEAVA